MTFYDGVAGVRAPLKLEILSSILMDEFLLEKFGSQLVEWGRFKNARNDILGQIFRHEELSADRFCTW